MNTVITKTYAAPPVNINEILRYSRCDISDPETVSLIEDCLKEASDILSYKVCYSILPLLVEEDICDFTYFKVQSKNLAKNLNGCNHAIVFSSTVGIKLDRLIAKYSKLSPSRALIFQAIGAERVEALCDIFCDDLEKEMNIKLHPRFSPGYGDLALETQKDIFKILDCTKNISVFLNNSLLMSPSKSVTAFIGAEL